MSVATEYPFVAVADAAPANRTCAIGLVLHENVRAWHAGEPTRYLFFASSDAARMPLRGTLQKCCACGAAPQRAADLRVDWLALHDAKACSGMMQADERVFAFLHCAACRDAAHFAVSGISRCMFELPPMDLRGEAFSLQITYEALCAARHTDSDGVQLDYLSRLRVHPYAVLKQGLPAPDTTWAELRDEHRRCAAPACGARANCSLVSFTMVYGERGERVKFGLAVCSNACSDAVRRDVVAGMSRQDACVRVRVVEQTEEGGKPVLHANECDACGRAPAQRCAGCEEVRYCSLACQARVWPAHKKRCRVVQRLLAEQRKT